MGLRQYSEAGYGSARVLDCRKRSLGVPQEAATQEAVKVSTTFVDSIKEQGIFRGDARFKPY